MSEFKLIIAGSRDFDDYELLSRVLFAMSDVETSHELDISDKDLSIVSGMTKGADLLGYKFAQEYRITCYKFPADWSKHGKSAGPIRNKQMGDFADGLLAFWDGKSRGTKHMIEYMKSINKPVTVIKY